MKQPIWKVWLSYLTELVLEREGTKLNPDLQLGLHKGRYCLSTPNAIYSYGDLYDNFYKAFQLLDIKKMGPERVLVLGFGIGSIPFMLENSFKLKCHYVGVEADETIAYWAAKYVLDELYSPVEMHIADAEIFADLCQEKFDLIAMDVFVDNEIPVQFESDEFLRNLKGLLSKNGVVLYNRLVLKDLDRENTIGFFENNFKAIFPNAHYLDVGGNWVLVNH